MKRVVYLLRHGEPEFGPIGKTCLGRIDLPLSKMGREQAKNLAMYFEGIDIIGIYHSPLVRCRETAELMSCGRWHCIPVVGLEEVDMGEWDGLTFEEIKIKDPTLYDQRGRYPVNTAPPGGESLRDAGKRFTLAFNNLLDHTVGNIAIVAHAGVNRMFICGMLKLDARQIMKIPQPYGCVNKLLYGSGLHVIEIGVLPT